MVVESIISSAAGTIPRPMMAETAEQADSMSGKMPRKVFTISGSSSKRTVILVARPKVPSEPTKTPRRA